MKTIKKQTIKTVPSATEKKKPAKKSGLSKSDPDYYKKIGQISAERRKLTPEQMSEMARKSHGPKSRRDGYHGGRRKKDAQSGTDAAVA